MTSGQHKYYYDEKELVVNVNGDAQDASGLHNPFLESTLSIKALLPNEEILTAIVEVESESEFRLWSDVSNWANGTLPLAGDFVEI